LNGEDPFFIENQEVKPVVQQPKTRIYDNFIDSEVIDDIEKFQ